MLKRLALFAALVLLSGCGGAMRHDVPWSRPNIVFIMTDDQAPWAWSMAGNPQIETPNMDRIAQEGALLANAFVVTPVCSPSRAELLTSRYGSELGITDWINHEWEGPSALAALEPDLGLDARTTTWAEVLQHAGYATGLIGKWHLGVRNEFHPTRAGYDEFIGFLAGGNSPVDPILEEAGETKEFEGFTQNILTDSALDFIRRHKDEPFLLSLHFRAPHTAWLPLPEEDWERYRDLDPQIPNPDNPKLDVTRVKRMMREYLGSVASVDRNLGRILTQLDSLGLSENTVVIFTSDHGYNMGHNGIWHKGNGHWVLIEPPPGTPNVPTGQRPNLYDNSLRVPTAVRWPAAITSETVVTETVTNLDWYPTLLAMAGLIMPDSVLVRGRNFLPLLRRNAAGDWENDLFAQYSTHHQSRTHMRAYRSSRFKLIRDFLNRDRDEFYDLENDPGETTNLVHSQDPVVQRTIRDLDASLREAMREIDDPVLGM